MTHLVFIMLSASLLTMAETKPSQVQNGAQPPQPTTQPTSQPTTQQSPAAQAQALALIGHNELHLQRLAEAQTNCDAALKLDPANVIAKDCLDRVAQMLVDQDLNTAEGKHAAGDNKAAIDLASKWINGGYRANQSSYAQDIVKRSRPSKAEDLFTALTPAWLRQALATVAIICAAAFILLAVRKLWREWQRGKWYGTSTRTNWTMIPLTQIPAIADPQLNLPTDAVLDAINRLGLQLERELWQPKLLLLKPTPPANYEPAIISDFCSGSLSDIVLAPGAGDLCLEWSLHDIQLGQAVQSLQFKTATGIDVGSIARFLGSIVTWFNFGAPAISGVAETATDGTFSLHLTARGGKVRAMTVSTSTPSAPGIDPVQISAERAAYKFLLRMRHPWMTVEEVDGFAALRQGASQFVQYAGTIPGTGPDACTRTSSLSKATFNFEFFRASIPLHCAPPQKLSRAEAAKKPADKAPSTTTPEQLPTPLPVPVSDPTSIVSSSQPDTDGDTRPPSLQITDEVRQAVLLAEGVAHAMIGSKTDRTCAIDCFRQLQDWPGTEETSTLRQQAAYNEAILWGQDGNYPRSVLMLTDLLGERAPDTVTTDSHRALETEEPASQLEDAIRFPARVARLSAFARYTRDEWSTLPRPRVGLLTGDAVQLIADLKKFLDPTTSQGDDGQRSISAHDKRIAQYMYIESLRATGHVELLRVITETGPAFYQNNRPIGLKTGDVSPKARESLLRAADWMVICEQNAPNYDLYCDLAEAYLLLKDFPASQGYARHATLQKISDIQRFADYERAYYLATESYYLQGTATSKALAVKYSSDFRSHATITLDEFKSVCLDLELDKASELNQTPQPQS
jgi:hypothetical protein